MRVFILILLFSNSIFAQNLYDKSVLIGGYPRIAIFEDTASSYLLPSNYFFLLGTQSSISDPKTGKFLFCTNGGRIFTDSIEIMKNGDTMLQEKMFNKWQDANFPQSTIIIPKNENQYYVIIEGLTDTMMDKYFANKDLAIDDFNYSIVDMSEENKKGKVIKRRIPLMKSPRLANWQMTACRHGNGKDWWLVKSHIFNYEFYMWHITEDTINGPFIQHLADSTFPWSNIGQGEFNKDATLYAQTGEYFHKVQISNFDRCSGLFSHYKTINVPFDSVYQDNYPTGLSFSNNGRFLYVCTNFNLWQFDLHESDSTKAWYHIAAQDTTKPNQSFDWYHQLKRAPDNKIYVGAWNGSGNPFMTIIESPDEKGVNCNLCKRCFDTKKYSVQPLANIYNYHLGHWENSTCDTIRNTHPTWLLYPNPAFNNLNLDVPNSKQGSTIVIEIFNMLGQLVEKKEYKININYQVEITLANYSRGIYFLKATYGNDKFISRFLKV